MRKRQIGYGILLISLLLFLLLFDRPFFLYLFLILILIAGCMYFFLKRDVRKIKANMKLKSAVRRGKNLQLVVETESKGVLVAAQALILELEIKNQMFEREKTVYYQLCLQKKEDEFLISMDTSICGEISVGCKRIWVQDLLGLYRIPVRAGAERRTLVYPGKADLQIEMSKQTIGSAAEEGFMQNRKGNDASEMFELRDYIPGDDIRSIHWKLSSKTENLVLRQASDPTHYNVILMMDLGMKDGEEALLDQELNASFAFGTDIAEKLLHRGMHFCMAIPTKRGLALHAITNERELRQAITQWLSTRIPEQCGEGLKYFKVEHLEQKFTKLILLSAGNYRPQIQGIDQKISITIINAVDQKETTHISISNTCEIIELPMERVEGQNCRIII